MFADGFGSGMSAHGCLVFECCRFGDRHRCAGTSLCQVCNSAQVGIPILGFMGIGWQVVCRGFAV
jgi:hypothetical protein